MVRSFAKEFSDNSVISNSRQGTYERLHGLNDNELREQASEWVREHVFMKASPNMTTSMFCEFVNSTLLPSHYLPPNFSRCISLRTVIRWLHKLGFKPKPQKYHIY